MTEENGKPPIEDTPPPRPKSRGLIRSMVLKSPAAAIHPEAVPVPPEPQHQERPERPFTNFVSGLLSFLVIVLFSVTAVFVMGQRQISAPGPLAADKIVIVRGSTGDVVDQLEREGVTDKGFLLSLYWQLTGKGSQIKGGEYLFRKEVSLEQITDTLIEGKSILHSVTIPEGRTSEEIAEILRNDADLAGDIKAVPKEGTLLPETSTSHALQYLSHTGTSDWTNHQSGPRGVRGRCQPVTDARTVFCRRWHGWPCLCRDLGAASEECSEMASD